MQLKSLEITKNYDGASEGLEGPWKFHHSALKHVATMNTAASNQYICNLQCNPTNINYAIKVLFAICVPDNTIQVYRTRNRILILSFHILSLVLRTFSFACQIITYIEQFSWINVKMLISQRFVAQINFGEIKCKGWHIEEVTYCVEYSQGPERGLVSIERCFQNFGIVILKIDKDKNSIKILKKIRANTTSLMIMMTVLVISDLNCDDDDIHYTNIRLNLWLDCPVLFGDNYGSAHHYLRCRGLQATPEPG